MMRLPKFRYLAPRTLPEAASILAGEGPEAMVVAGGTDLFPNMKRRHQTPRVLVALRRVDDLRGVRGTVARGLRIGPATTLTDLEENPTLRGGYPGQCVGYDSFGGVDELLHDVPSEILLVLGLAADESSGSVGARLAPAVRVRDRAM